jgi:hypothetical protein
MLSLLLESLQSYLPARVPSNVDWLLNSAGACAGAMVANALEAVGGIAQWNRFRERWLVGDSSAVFVLIVLWPCALLFPAAVPLGLGQVVERLEAALAQALAQTPFLDWMPVRDIELQPLVPLVELVCVALGLLAPMLLAYSMVRGAWRRAVAFGVLLALALGVTALSAALSYGPAHAWGWLSEPVRWGLVVGVVASLAALGLPLRVCCALALVTLLLHVSLLNQAPTSAYFSQTLQTWQQGQFIRFHGLAQWLGWLWPYAALIYLLGRVSRAHHLKSPHE